MKFKNLALWTCVLLLVPAVAFAHDGEHHGEEASVNNAVAHFAAIGTALAADSVEGVADHAFGILAIMDTHYAVDVVEDAVAKQGGHGAHEGQAEMKEHHEGMDMNSEKMEAMHTSMRSALQTLAAEDTDLATAREAYKSLSADFVPMAQKMYEKGEVDPDWAVMECPMVKAEWIQVDGKVANPYYGSKMLTCGKKVANLAGASHEMHGDMDHEGHDMKDMKKDEHKEHHHGG